jgi:hypothetical protein
MRCLPEVIPEPVGTGLIPASFANAASEWIRSGLSPATMRISAAVSTPMPNSSSRCSLHDELLNHGHKFLDLLIKGKPAFRDRTKRMTDRVVWGF